MSTLTKEKEVIAKDIIDPEINVKVSKEDKEALINSVSDKKSVEYLVNQYYQAQSFRIIAENQIRALLQQNSENDILPITEKIKTNARKQEELIKKYMNIVTDAIPVCRWIKSITGIGPVISAYLYSKFDVTVAQYSTNFLSYAGLNDNNNPWLGKEKAKAIVKKALIYRDEKFEELANFLKNEIGEESYDELVKTIKTFKLKNNDIEFDDIRKKILKSTDIDIEKINGLDVSMFFDYVKNILNPNICDDILIKYVALETTRNPNNISKSIKSSLAKKKTKSKVPTVADLESYLAKPPYNTDLKKMMYIIGDMFIKNSGREKSLYGKIYKDKKLEYSIANENGAYADTAKRILTEKNWSKDTSTYKALSEGKLSDAHITTRARRYAVKLFISHVFECMYYAEYKKEPPKHYVIQYMGHHDYIPPEVDYRPFIDSKE